MRQKEKQKQTKIKWTSESQAWNELKKALPKIYTLLFDLKNKVALQHGFKSGKNFFLLWTSLTYQNNLYYEIWKKLGLDKTNIVYVNNLTITRFVIGDLRGVQIFNPDFFPEFKKYKVIDFINQLEPFDKALKLLLYHFLNEDTFIYHLAGHYCQEGKNQHLEIDLYFEKAIAEKVWRYFDIPYTDDKAKRYFPDANCSISRAESVGLKGILVDINLKV